MDIERSTHTCKTCGTETTYWTYKPERIDIIPIVKCPVCDAFVSELSGAQVIGYFKKKAWE